MLNKRWRRLSDKKAFLRKLQGKPVKLRRNFIYGGYRNVARIHMRSSYSNIFVSLTDVNNKLIICCTSGSREYAKLKD